MKRLVLVLFTLLLLGSSVFALNPEELNSITFYNNTGFDIWYLFFSPGDSDEWGADILGSTRTLANGLELDFYIHYPAPCNTFDFMAIDEEGDAYYIWDFEICDGREAFFEITLDNYDPTGSVDFEFAEVNLENGTPYEMYFVFYSPSDSQMWGVDMLDSETTLGPGEALSLLVPVSAAGTSYDVRAVDEEYDDYAFRVEVDDSQESFGWLIEMSDLQ
jgi:hypothetical protein